MIYGRDYYATDIYGRAAVEEQTTGIVSTLFLSSVLSTSVEQYTGFHASLSLQDTVEGLAARPSTVSETILADASVSPECIKVLSISSTVSITDFLSVLSHHFTSLSCPVSFDSIVAIGKLIEQHIADILSLDFISTAERYAVVFVGDSLYIGTALSSYTIAVLSFADALLLGSIARTQLTFRSSVHDVIGLASSCRIFLPPIPEITGDIIFPRITGTVRRR